MKFKNGLLYKYRSRLSKRLYNSCDRILVTSQPFIDYLSKTHSISASRFGYLPQHADSSMLSLDLSKKETGDKIHFMYAGNFGAGQTLDVIIQATNLLRDRTDFVVDMVGDGSKRVELEEMVKDFGLSDTVIFHGNKNRSDMPHYYQKADVLLITLRGNNAVGNTMPGKLQTYMTVGKPILGAINGAAKQVIEESKCGSCVNAGDYHGLARLMSDFLDHPEKFCSCGNNARLYFRQHFLIILLYLLIS